MDVLESPFLMFLLILLTVLSTWFSWKAFRNKDSVALLYAIGTGIPTFSLTEWEYWAIGLTVCGLGVWLHRRMTNL